MTPISIEFGGVAIPYETGAPSVAVPGVPAGCAELHRRFGRLPWADVIQPSIELARAGVPLPAAHAKTLRSMTQAMLVGDGVDAYAPEGKLLDSGQMLFHPGLAETLTTLATEGAEVFYTGRYGELTVETIAAGGGILTEADLTAYRVTDLPTVTAGFFGYDIQGRVDLNAAIPTLASMTAADPVSVARALDDWGPRTVGNTTNISVVDSRGDACVVTTTLGIGSGIWLPGLGVHLNSMLGETELLAPGPLPGNRTTGPLPGDRMASMMCPLVVTDTDGLVLAAGSAGASRIRTALVHTLVGTLVDGLSVDEAIARPRFHPAGGVLHAEPGLPAKHVAELRAAGYQVEIWDGLHHYFGGASAVGIGGAAGDPRRGGVGVIVDA